MKPEIEVLRALLRLARRRLPVTADALLDRVACEPPDARRALKALERAGLVQRTPRGPQLTLSGFAVAVATTAAAPAPRERPSTPTARTGRVVPLARRGRAA